jgi:two-component system cell cycle response regulator DivK
MSKRILVVEDQEDLRAILRAFLSASGYSVIEAVDGAESVAKAASERPDLVLMDIQLPVLDGYDATRQIKALPGFATIPIIAVSSIAMKGDEEKARASGCDDYVTKPYSPSICSPCTALSRADGTALISGLLVAVRAEMYVEDAMHARRVGMSDAGGINVRSGSICVAPLLASHIAVGK